MSLNIRQAYLKSLGATITGNFGKVESLAFTTNGTNGLSVEDTKTRELSGKFVTQKGTVAAPAISNEDDETTGIAFNSTGDEIVHSVGGVEKSRITATEEKKMVALELRERNQLRMYDSEVGNAYYIAVRAATGLSQDYTFTWPSNYGSLNQPIISDGAGGLSFGSAASISGTTYDIVFGETIAQHKVIGVDATSQKALTAVDEYGWSIAPTNTNHARTTSCILDGSGNIILCGIYKGTLTFSGASAITSGQTGTNWSMFLTRIDPTSRDADWAISFDDVLDKQNNGNVLFTDGTDIWVSGTFSSAYTLVVPDVSNLTTAGGASIFVAKVTSSTGTVTATLQADSASGDSQNVVHGIAISSTVGYLCGYMESQITFDSAVSVAGTRQLFVVKFTSSLASWTWNAIPDSDYGYSMAMGMVLDGSNQPNICGYFEGTLALNGLTTLTSSGNYDAFVAQVNTSGVWQWSNRGGGADMCKAISIDLNSTSLYIGGSFKSSLTVPSVSGTLASVGDEDIFVAEINTSGVWQWTSRCGGHDTTCVMGGLSYSSNGIHICGTFDKEFDCFGVPILRSRSSGLNSFVAKLNTVGAFQWSTRSNNGSIKNVGGIDSDTTGAVMGGTFMKSTSFGSQAVLSSASAYKDVVAFRVNNRIYPIGVSLESGVLDDTKTMAINGLGTLSSLSLTPGLIYRNNNGALSATTSGVVIGRAVASDKLLFGISYDLD